MKTPRIIRILAPALLGATLAVSAAAPARALVCLPIDKSYRHCDEACRWEAWLPLAYPVCM